MSKLFNITAQVFKNNDTSKQNRLINEIHNGSSSDEALGNFKLHFPSIEYSLVKILSVEEISQEAA
jgi:type II secretory pathway component PulF